MERHSVQTRQNGHERSLESLHVGGVRDGHCSNWMQQILLSRRTEVTNVVYLSYAIKKRVRPQGHHERLIVVISASSGIQPNFNFADVWRPDLVGGCIRCPLQNEVRQEIAPRAG